MVCWFYPDFRVLRVPFRVPSFTSLLHSRWKRASHLLRSVEVHGNGLTLLGYNSASMPILDINEIRGILPHRYPMLLVDRIVELEAERIVGIKNVTVNEPFFAGHFPDFPVMPGVLIVEAMAQTAGVLVLKSIPDRESQAGAAGVRSKTRSSAGRWCPAISCASR